LTNDIISNLLKNYPNYILEIPKKYITVDLAKLVMTQNPKLLNKIDKFNLKYEVIDAIYCNAMTYPNFNISNFNFNLMYKMNIIKKICSFILKNNGNELKNIPEKYRTDELYYIAINNNINSIKYINANCIS